MSTPRDKIEAKLGVTGPPLQTVRDHPPTIPDHELTRCIGQGAYGEVWLARNAFGTWRAVKIVYRDNFRDARPYEREFAGIRRFEPISRNNEGFVDILQVGRDHAGGWFYYVMELADSVESAGETLRSREWATEGDPPAHVPNFSPATYTPRTLSRDLAHRGRLPLEDCLELGLTLTLALGHLHRHGLIHRDVKPSNIIYVGGVPKLADIGLVTEAQGANTFVGTEGFVPPEGPTSPQADIFALGKVLYEGSMGKDRNEFPEPFTQISTDLESVALMELNAVLLRACAPDPTKRYTTAEEMHADLALLHSGGSVKRRHHFDRQFQLVKQVGAVAIAATFLISGAWIWQRQQTQKMTWLAEDKNTLAIEKTKLADDLAKLGEENRNRIVRLDIANGVRLLDGGDPAGALLWLADALPLVTNKPAEESIHRIRIQQTLDRIPHLSRFLPQESETMTANASPDGRLLATGTRHGSVRVRNVETGKSLWGPTTFGASVYHVRFSRDGRRLFVSSSPEQMMFETASPFVPPTGFAAVLDAATGAEVFPFDKLFPNSSSNLVWSAFSPDDRWLALAERSGAIRLIDLNTGGAIGEPSGHKGVPLFLSFSADGSLLASASEDKTVRLWRLPSGEPAGLALQHRGQVVRVLFSGDGRYLLSASIAGGDERGAEFQVWEVATGTPVGASIPASRGGYSSAFVAPGAVDQFFIHDALNPKLVARRFSSPGEVLFMVEEILGGIQCWSFNEDGSRVALGTTDGSARVFHVKDGKPASELFRTTVGAVTTILLEGTGGRLQATLGEYGTYLWDLRERPAETIRQKLPAPLLEMSPETRDAQMGTAASGMPIWLTEIRQNLRFFDDHLEEMYRFQKPGSEGRFRGTKGAWHSRFRIAWRFDPDGKAVYLWRDTGGKNEGQMLEHPAEALEATFTGDDRFLITTCADRKLRKWRTADGTLQATIPMPDNLRGRILDISPDGRTALWVEFSPADGALANQLQFFDLNAAELIGERVRFTLTLNSAEFSPNGRHVAVLDRGGLVTILESRTGRVISNRIRHSINLISVAWDPPGGRLLTAGHNDEVLVWEIATGAQVFGPLRLSGGPVRVASWSPDGRFIVARNDHKLARVWDAATGEAVTPPIPHDGEVTFARMNGNQRLITASYPDLLRAWDLKGTDLPPDVLGNYAQLISARRLDHAGVMLSLRSEELEELSRSLRQRAPQLFK